MTTVRENAADFHPEILAEMAEHTQWVGWRYGRERPNGKREKVPINPRTGRKARSDDPTTWGTIEEAKWALSTKDLDGIGFMLTGEDPFVFVDLDGCRNPDTGEVEPWAAKVIEALDSYAEASPSGTGAHVYALGELPGKGIKTAHVEVYDRGRFCTVSGDVIGTRKPVNARQKVLERLCVRIGRKATQEPTQAPREAVPVALEDEELLGKARAAANGAKFRRLHDEGDLSDHDGDHSGADFSLMKVLAFWTGRDPARMERMFDASALGQRRKWTGRPDYRRRTVERAVSETAHVYDPHWRRPDPTGPKADGEVMGELGSLHALALTDPWTGRTGPAERWLLHALLKTGSDEGTMTGEGVVVPASSRHLAPLCGKHRQRVEPLLKKLQERGWARLVSEGKGSHGSLYLLTRPPQSNCCQEEINTGGGAQSKCQQKEASPSTTHPVCFLGNTWTGVLARVRNPPPQSENEYDKNGRPIWQEDRYLLRDLGDMGALLIEKVAARPGTDLAGLAGALGRDPSNVRKALSPIVEGGFVEERDGGYFPAGRLDELVERHLEYSGSNERERKLRKRYAEEREDYRPEYEKRREEKSRAERLKETARDCGVPEGEMRQSADVPQEQAVIGSVAEVFDLARSVLPPVEDPVILPPIPGRGIRGKIQAEKKKEVVA
ncbi:MAG: hypothetical protein M3P49_01720 [Actinomycetota bacterium]|nr:hypothetical protein [Actinomycetota bacterium]